MDLGVTLASGQAFRWWEDSEQPGVWEGVAEGRFWRLRLHGGDLVGQAAPAIDPAGGAAWLRRYFALDTPGAAVQAAIAAAHPAGKAAVERYPGLRILRQDATETLLNFSVASATNVPRLRRALDAIATLDGPCLAESERRRFHAFPAPEVIADLPVARLAGPGGLAYRGVHLQAAARALVERGSDWLPTLARGSYRDAHAALDALPHIGPKIADCICLFGLGFDEAVPIDTHIWAISHELFGTQIPSRTLTPRTYAYLGDLWRDRFGPWAGWAQQYLFQWRRDEPIRERFRPERGRRG